MKELLTAFLLLEGLRSKNHQCLFSYFYKKFLEYEFEVHLIMHLCYVRNRLEYYGEPIDLVFYEKNKEDIEKTIALLFDILN